MSAKFILLPKIFFVQLLLLCLPLCGQSRLDPPHKVLHEKLTVLLTVDIDGNAVRTKAKSLAVSDFSESAELLRMSSIKNELELTVAQSKKIAGLLEQAQKKRESFRKQITRLNNAETRKRLQKEFIKYANEFSDREDAILLKHQRKLLSQIANRIRCRQHGPMQFIKELEKTDKRFVPSQLELERVKKVQATLKPELKKRITSALATARQELVKPLNEKQLDKLKTLLPSGVRTQNFDLFIAQLDRKNSETWSLQRGENIFDRLVVYFVLPDGALIKQKSTGRLYQSTEAELILPYMEWAESLRSGSWGRKISIDQRQKELLDDLLAELGKLEKEIADRVANSDNPALAIEVSRDQQVFHVKKSKKQILGMMNFTQKSKLQRLYLQTAVGRFGLFSELTSGQLGKVIAVSETQKKDIEKAAIKISKQLKKKASEIEAHYFKNLVECFEAQNRKIVVDQFGKDLKHVSANVTMLLAGLSLKP